MARASWRFRYNAFISFSHAVDGKLAPAIEHGLKRFAKPAFQLRALEVFRDASVLSANPALWRSIENALAGAEHLILMASPEAALSSWVAKEVDTWLRTRPADAMLIVVTDGDIAWDDGAHDFDWDITTALPDRLRGVFTEEPRWIDLRWARAEADISLNNPRFRDAIADLAAPLHHRPKDEIIGEDVVQHRRFRRLTRSAIAALVVLVIALGASNDGTVRTWDATSGAPLNTLDADENGVMFAAFSPDDTRVLVSSGFTARIWGARMSRLLLTKKLEGPAQTAAYSPDGRRIVSASAMGNVRVWDAATGKDQVNLRWGASHAEKLAPDIPGLVDPVVFSSFSHDGNRVVFLPYDNTVRIWFVGRTLDYLMHSVRSKLPRCLIADQEKTFFLREATDETPVDPDRCRR